MNKQASDILNTLLLEPFINQRILSEVSGHSLGVVNRSLKNLIKEGYVDEHIRPTEKAKLKIKSNSPQNAIILAAGFGMRMVPINTQTPKALMEVNGETLIERTIEQLHEVGVKNIYVVVGYMKEQFEYLIDEYGVELIVNEEYAEKNNLHSLHLASSHLSNSSIYAAREYIKNSYICSSDNYFITNPFESDVDESYYAAVYMEGQTGEWCILEEDGWIKDVKVGGQDSWVMLGHVFWSESFSRSFLHILEDEYEWPETADKLWETIYIEHINDLPMKIRKYPADFIFEFDTLDELREFDDSYISNTRSEILTKIAGELGVEEKEIRSVKAFKDKDNAAAGFTFETGKKYKYYYRTEAMEEL